MAGILCHRDSHIRAAISNLVCGGISLYEGYISCWRKLNMDRGPLKYLTTVISSIKTSLAPLEISSRAVSHG
jgi:hypothetical protein